MESVTQTVFPIQRSASQIAAMRQICQSASENDFTSWSFDHCLSALSLPGGMGLFVAGDDLAASWRGLLVAQVGPFACDLLYIYVAPQFRRQGVARKLIGYLEKQLANVGTPGQIRELFLEVRPSNIPAHRLYSGLGLHAINRRRAYYSDGEDALVLRKSLIDGQSNSESLT